MSGMYRDDLEAAQARASDLEREINDLRRRNAALEAVEPRHDTTDAAAHWSIGLLILTLGVISAVVAGITSNLKVGAGSFALFATGLIYLYVAERNTHQ